MRVEFGEVVFPVEFGVSGPSFPNLQQEEIPAGIPPVLHRRFSAEIAKRIVWQGPTFQVEAARFSLRSANSISELRQQGSYRGLAIHGRKQVGAHPVNPNQGNG